MCHITRLPYLAIQESPYQEGYLSCSSRGSLTASSVTDGSYDDPEGHHHPKAMASAKMHSGITRANLREIARATSRELSRRPSEISAKSVKSDLRSYVSSAGSSVDMGKSRSGIVREKSFNEKLLTVNKEKSYSLAREKSKQRIKSELRADRR